MSLTLNLRARATADVMARFDKPFSWQGANCIRLAREQGEALGHSLPPVPAFRTALGARRALQKRGAETVADLLDQFFSRWEAPAFARVGDLCILPPEADGDGLEAVCVADGMGNLFGWHGSDPTRLSAIKFAQGHVLVAWRL
jgi:hypothetical protein